jgi:alkylhydroperoxidase family enzyme
MARLSFKLPSQIDDAECRGWLETAVARGKPGPEFQAIRAHAPGVMRSFTMSRQWLYHEGVLDFELKELLRAYIALAGECSYCSSQGVAREIRADKPQLDELLAYETSDRYSPRQKLALRYADAIMWDPALADDALWQELRAEFTEPELVELGYWIGFTFGGQRWLRTLGATQGQLQAALDAGGEAETVFAGPTSSD